MTDADKRAHLRDLLWDIQDAVAYLEVASLDQAFDLAARLRASAVELAAIRSSRTLAGVEAQRRAIERICREAGELRARARAKLAAADVVAAPGGPT